MSASETKHVDELTIMRLAENELSKDREDVTRKHLIECARCRAGYEALKAETQLLRASVHAHDEALPGHIRPRQADVSLVLVAILVFGTLGVSSLWSRYITPLVDMFDSMESVGLDGTSVATTFLIRSLLWRGWSDMFMKLIQGAVLLAVIVLAAYVFTWAWRRLRSSRSSAATLSVLTVLAGLLAPPPGTDAAEIELDIEVYTLHEGDVVENDLIVGAEEVRIEGTVDGDLIVAANQVEVSGVVAGDILGFAETINITGQVGGSVRTGSRWLHIEGTVGRNITAAGQTIRLASGTSLGGSFAAAAREAVIDAPVPRDVIVAGKTIEVNARVEGDVLAAGGDLRVGEDGGIGGDTVFHGRNEPVVADGADLASPIDYEPIEEEEENPVVGFITGFIYFWTAAFVFGAALMLLLPEACEEIVTTYVPDYGKSFVHGVLSFLVVGASGMLIMLTLVGLPLGVTALFLLGVAAYVAQVFVAAYIGREILGTPTSASAGIGRLALGLFLVHVAKCVPILGSVISLLVMVWGFGAISAYLLGRARGRTPIVEAPAEAGV